MSTPWDPKARGCGNCRFFPLSNWSERNWHEGSRSAPHPNIGGGECRRRAPVILPVNYGDQVQNETKFPAMSVYDPGCGEFEQREGFGKDALSDRFIEATNAAVRGAP